MRLNERRRGFTLVELLVVILIISSLAALLVPTVFSARRKLYKVQCKTNLSSIAKLATMYADDHRGFLPFPKGLDEPQAYESFQIMVDRLEDARRPKLYICPESEDEEAEVEDKETGMFQLTEDNVSYTWRRKRTRVGKGGRRIMSCDNSIADDSLDITENHTGGINAVKLDTSVEWLDMKEDLGLNSADELEEYFEEHGLTK